MPLGPSKKTFENDLAILEYIFQYPGITYEDLVNQLANSKYHPKPAIKRLVAEGLIYFSKHERGAFNEVKSRGSTKLFAAGGGYIDE